MEKKYRLTLAALIILLFAGTAALLVGSSTRDDHSQIAEALEGSPDASNSSVDSKTKNTTPGIATERTTTKDLAFKQPGKLTLQKSTSSKSSSDSSIAQSSSTRSAAVSKKTQSTSLTSSALNGATNTNSETSSNNTNGTTNTNTNSSTNTNSGTNTSDTNTSGSTNTNSGTNTSNTNTGGSTNTNSGTNSSTSTTAPSQTTSTQATTPPNSPSCQAHWGAYVDPFQRTGSYNASDKLQAINYVESQMGRKFAIDHQFYRWDDFVSNYNINNYIKPSIGQGRTPFLSWKPVYKNNTNIAWSSIAAGDHDTLIRQKAQQVKSIGSPVYLVFGHEADARVGTFQPGQVQPVDGHIKTDAGSAADFVAAYRHVHDVFAQEGVTNVSWAWIMTRAPFEPNAGARSANLLYPGNNYVDIVGLDPYNFFHGGNWREMQTLMGGFTSWVTANNITKPWMIGEWGSVEDPNQPGRKAQWLRNAADYFESEPRLKYIIHFDSFPAYNWLFDSSASSKEAWKEISNRSYFTCP